MKTLFLTIFIAAIVSLSGHGAFAKNLIFFIHNSDVREDIYSTDQLSTQRGIEQLQRYIKLNHFDDTVVEIGVNNLSQLGEEISTKIAPGDLIRGVFVTGHGNKGFFAFSEIQVIEGNLMGELFAHALKNLSLAPNFTIHLNSCYSGCDTENGWSLQKAFIQSFTEKMGKQVPEVLNVSAHEYAVNGNSLKNPEILGLFLYKTGAAKPIDKVFMKASIFYGSYGILAAHLAPFFLGLAIGNSLLMSHWDPGDPVAFAGIGIEALGVTVTILSLESSNLLAKIVKTISKIKNEPALVVKSNDYLSRQFRENLRNGSPQSEECGSVLSGQDHTLKY